MARTDGTDQPTTNPWRYLTGFRLSNDSTIVFYTDTVSHTKILIGFIVHRYTGDVRRDSGSHPME